MADTRSGITKGRKTPRRKVAIGKRLTAKKPSSFAARGLIEASTKQAYRRGRRMVESAYATASDAMRDITLPDRRQVESFAEHNPLLLGAVALGLGVIIGSLLPRYGHVMPADDSAPRRARSAVRPRALPRRPKG